jgi:hypothetical protein
VSIKVTAFSFANRLGTLAKQSTRSVAAKNAAFMAQPYPGCDGHINTLLHSTTGCQSAIRTHVEVMSTSSYSPVRSAIILTISFLLPLLLSLYSDRLTNVYTSLWSPGANFAATNWYNDTTTQSDSILAQQHTVRSPSYILSEILTLLQEEASRLLQNLRRDSGQWNSNHPRWRLMNSMKAYLQYGEEHTSELNIWRKRYKKLPRSQRSV